MFFSPGRAHRLRGEGGHGPTQVCSGFHIRTNGEPSPMTLDRIALKELADKGSDADLLREMLAFITAQLMEMEVDGLTGAAHGARTG